MKDDEPLPPACDSMAHEIGLEIKKAYTGQQSDEDALVNIDEILGAATGAETTDGPPSPEMLAFARAVRFGPRNDDGP